MRWILLCLMFVALRCVAASQHYEGTAYTMSDAHVAYKEEHFVFEDHGIHTRLVLYRCPSDEPFARKWVRAIAGDEAPNFDLVDARDGYREGVRGEGERREVYVQDSRRAPLRSALLPTRENVVIDAGFDAYVRDHWDEIGTLDKAQIAFLVPSRLGYVDLRLRPADAAEPDGAAVHHLRLVMDAWFGFIVPSIDLAYADADRRLLRFQGLSNIRDVAGRSQKVRIEFPRSGVFGPPGAEEIARAAALPLVAHCPP
jgi:hypothetical protein